MHSGSAIRKFSEACVELYRPGLTLSNFTNRSYRFWESLIPSEFVAFGSLNLETQALDIGLSQIVPSFPEAMEAFGRLMGNYELFCWDPAVNDGAPFYRSDFFSQRQFRELDVYSEVYQKIDADNHCAVHIPTHANEIAFFGIERKSGPDFSPEEKIVIEQAQAHLSNARNVVLAQAEMAEGKAEPEYLADAGLSPREAEVLAWIAEGKSNNEIALLLGLQLYTVKDYVKLIFQKIAVENRLAAALWAIRTSKRQRLLLRAQTTVNVPSTGGRLPERSSV